MEGTEMLRAMYEFNATIEQTLSFKRDEYFIFHSNNNIKKNWWNVINANGKVGYIPSNYVTTIKVNIGKLVEFLTCAIERLSCDISNEGGRDKLLETMKELISRKQEIMDKKNKYAVAAKEKLTSTKSLPNSRSSEVEIKSVENTKEPAPLVMRVSQSDVEITPSMNERSVPDTSISLQDCNVTVNSVYTLIQMVRCQTGLSHDDSRLAVGVVAEGLLDVLPLVASSGLEKVLDKLRSPLEPPPSLIDKTEDAIMMRKALKHLTAARDDAQQRSWALWDDEAAIRQSILDLSSILTNADPIICKRVLKLNDFSDVLMLVDYYQMEERASIRQILIQAFAIMCCLDMVIISLLLNSVLPMELAREMQSNANNSKLHKPAMLLAMILSSGEAMPITHLDQLGIEFVKMILDVIEQEANSEIGDTMLTLVLSYNLQFKRKSPANITVQAVSEVHTTKNFTEKVLLLINREVDPVSNLKTPMTPCNSVLKLLMDLFQNPSTAELFYTNDVRVLMDIIMRQITDLSPNSQKRTDYLELCKLVLISCEPLAFEHRLDELKSRFSYILTEEVPQVDRDKDVVREIIASLPQFFGESFQSP